MLSISRGLRLSMFQPTTYYYFLDIFHEDADKAAKYRGFITATYSLGGILGMQIQCFYSL